jgi:hypothetical protein
MIVACPDGWHLDVFEVIADGDRAAAQARVRQGDQTLWCAGFYSVVDGAITDGVEHWVTQGAETPPPWRSRFATG